MPPIVADNATLNRPLALVYNPSLAFGDWSRLHVIRSLALLAALTAGTTGCVTTGTATESAVIRAKEKVAQALVHVRPVKQVFREGERQEFSVIGSGFIISRDEIGRASCRERV